MNACLLDTGVLLRMAHRGDAQAPIVRRAVYRLRAQGVILCVAPQNLAEFCVVSTRPPTARGGLGITVAHALARLQRIERLITLLPEVPEAYAQWRTLLGTHQVVGVQAHDARLAALMIATGVDTILTLNTRDFARYSGITAVHPRDIL